MFFHNHTPFPDRQVVGGVKRHDSGSLLWGAGRAGGPAGAASAGMAPRSRSASPGASSPAWASSQAPRLPPSVARDPPEGRCAKPGTVGCHHHKPCAVRRLAASRPATPKAVAT